MKTNAFIRNSFGYQGLVKITYKDRGYQHSVMLKNEGTKYLGDLISIVLAGDLTSLDSVKDRCPSALNFEVEMNANEWRSLLSINSPLTSGVWGEVVPDIENTNAIGKTKFSSVISTGSVIRGYDSAVNGKNLRLKLINNRKEELAYIYDKTDNTNRTLPLLYTALVNGQDALVDWTMFIQNN